MSNTKVSTVRHLSPNIVDTEFHDSPSSRNRTKMRPEKKTPGQNTVWDPAHYLSWCGYVLRITRPVFFHYKYSFISLSSCSRSVEPVGSFLPPAALHCAGPRTQRQLPGPPFRRHPPAAWRDGEEMKGFILPGHFTALLQEEPQAVLSHRRFEGGTLRCVCQLRQGGRRCAK